MSLATLLNNLLSEKMGLDDDDHLLKKIANKEGVLVARIAIAEALKPKMLLGQKGAIGIKLSSFWK